jgi:hypothetical protein
LEDHQNSQDNDRENRAGNYQPSDGCGGQRETRKREAGQRRARRRCGSLRQPSPQKGPRPRHSRQLFVEFPVAGANKVGDRVLKGLHSFTAGPAGLQMSGYLSPALRRKLPVGGKDKIVFG